MNNEWNGRSKYELRWRYIGIFCEGPRTKRTLSLKSVSIFLDSEQSPTKFKSETLLFPACSVFQNIRLLPL